MTAIATHAPGTFCWADLGTTDATGAKHFYTGLFGWNARTDPGGYTEWHRGEAAVGGMIAIDPQWGPMPPHWLPYFMVSDCDASTGRANELGGRTMMPPREIPKVGRFALLADPQGAGFAVIKLAM